MKKKYIKLKAFLLAGAIAASPLIVSGCNEKETSVPVIAEMSTTYFGIGEHIISIPLADDIRNKRVQYEYYPGYEPVGISISAYAPYSNAYGGGSILYVNTEEVECTSTLAYPNGCYLYTEIGTPLKQEVRAENTHGNIKEFGIGEHIISIPITTDNREENFQYEYHEGYEVVGIGTTAYGKYTNSFGGSIILYKNVVPVKCINSDEGYVTFGTPIEVVKTKTK